MRAVKKRNNLGDSLMRKKYWLVLVLIVFISVGCTKEKIVTSRLEPMNIKKLSHELKACVDRRIGDNGIYQLHTSNGNQYLFLNGSNVVQGEEEAYYENIKIEDDKNIAKIYFNELYTADYQDKELESMKLYKILLKDTINSIGIYKNGKETYFDSIDIVE
ncbi:MAG: hypothetical protein K0S71_1744 [Clostridia bacterium]|jgi:hypothetical protein|nr:hypothetical protein [Clostridia bacterium]